MIAIAPAFLIGILAIFFALAFIIYMGLALIVKLQKVIPQLSKGQQTDRLLMLRWMRS